MYLEGQTMESA